MDPKFTLSDDVIVAVARAVQLAMLTATDVVDHLRLLELEPSTENPGVLTLTAACVERNERNVVDLLERAKELHARSLEDDVTCN